MKNQDERKSREDAHLVAYHVGVESEGSEDGVLLQGKGEGGDSVKYISVG